MNTTTIKTPENLTWRAITTRYPVATVKIDGKSTQVDTLKDAIEDGTLLAEVEEAAAAQNVQPYEVFKRMSVLLSSNMTNIKKRYDSPSKAKDMRTCTMLREFVKQNMNRINSVKTTEDKSAWQYTTEEIEAIPLDDIKKLAYVRDGMASKLSKYPGNIPEDFHKHYAAACARLSEAKRLAKQKADATKVELNQETLDLVEKLKAGKSLSKDDKAALAAVLESLSK